MSKLKVIHVYGRPHGHPIHIMYSKSWNADYIHEDRLLQWQNKDSTKIRRYISWFLNALFFPSLNKYDIILTEGVRPAQLIQKKLGLIKSNQKLIALMADESLYFTYSKFFPALTRKLMVSYWKNCDGIICIGEYQTTLAKNILAVSHHTKVRTIYNGISQKNQVTLNQLKPNFSSKKILFIGNIGAKWRSYYKGLDLIIKAFNISRNLNVELELEIVGEINYNIKNELLKMVDDQNLSSITFHGPSSDLESHFRNSCLYIHTSRGDSFPTTTMEALSSGIPCLISNETGSKEIIEKISTEFLTTLHPEDISNRINWFLNLSQEKKEEFSSKGKIIMKNYTEKGAKESFNKAIIEITNNL